MTSLLRDETPWPIPAGATITAIVDNGSGSYTLTVDVQITTAPSGSIGFSGAAGTDLTGKYGTLNLAADGSYIYTPFANNASLAAGAVVGVAWLASPGLRRALRR